MPLKQAQLAVLYLQFFFELIGLGLYTLYILLKKSLLILLPGPLKSVKNEVILVTGGANGIGREICRHIARYETCLTIISWDIDVVGNQNLRNELEALGVKKTMVSTVDVSNQKQVEAAARKIRQEIGDVTILFNNAGIPGDLGEGWTNEPDSVKKVFNVNFLSHCWTIREFLPGMLKRKTGHIVETCSILAFGAAPSGSSYVASKQAMNGYIESIKEDLRNLTDENQVLISLVYPHNTATNLTAGAELQARKYHFLFPQLLPSYVASKILYGVLRNQEHIYVPGYLRLFHSILPILPPETIRKCIDVADIHRVDEL
ncbi:unnamed protein product [Allacma fusca]|uniref:Uncharacterized protein n=1 Tax=Allacma fusca TaxID=39272 RepID=A0A8J2PD00_9HEXA|nr:unnamed protein product [Allacma fusca]